MTTGEIVAAAIFGIWFSLTVMVQLPWSWCKLPRKFEPSGHLFPGWHFFSPKPIIADIEVMYRWVPGPDPDAAPTEWVDLVPNCGRPARHVLIHAHRRTRKTIFHCAHQLILALQAFPERRRDLCLTVPYLLLLDRVSSLCPGAACVQFRIDILRHGGHPAVTVFTSLSHAVDSEVESGELELEAVS
ncbi:MAG: hypothetical protein ABJC09_15780 [Terriglobia bacterium]